MAPNRVKIKKIENYGLSAGKNIPLHLQRKQVHIEGFQKIKNGAPIRFRDAIAESSN